MNTNTFAEMREELLDRMNSLQLDIDNLCELDCVTWATIIGLEEVYGLTEDFITGEKLDRYYAKHEELGTRISDAESEYRKTKEALDRLESLEDALWGLGII